MNPFWRAISQSGETVITSVRHFRLQNKRDVLKRFQAKTSSLRPLIDEIEDPSDPLALVLRHLHDDLLKASATQRHTRLEIKLVARKVLDVLKVLHGDGYVHADVKPDNVLVNYGQGKILYADVKLADFGSTVGVDSVFPKDRDMIGAPIWRSPEAQLQIG